MNSINGFCGHLIDCQPPKRDTAAAPVFLVWIQLILALGYLWRLLNLPVLFFRRFFFVG
jgi:hypothetical protein